VQFLVWQTNKEFTFHHIVAPKKLMSCPCHGGLSKNVISQSDHSTGVTCNVACPVKNDRQSIHNMSGAKNWKWTKQNKKNIHYNAGRLAKAFEIMVISDSKPSLITYHTVYIHEACNTKSLIILCHCDICLDGTWWICCGTWCLNVIYLT
jgi:hypothetical protein